jgi:hypothetical protein
MKRQIPWLTAAALALLFCGVLGFYGPTRAAPPAQNQPFANAVEQRAEMIGELKAIHELLAEQNKLLAEQNALLRAAAGEEDEPTNGRR